MNFALFVRILEDGAVFRLEQAEKYAARLYWRGTTDQPASYDRDLLLLVDRLVASRAYVFPDPIRSNLIKEKSHAVELEAGLWMARTRRIMANDNWPEPEVDEPSEEELEQMSTDSIVDATDGCRVEPDGTCEHGHPSWLLRLGLI